VAVAEGLTVSGLGDADVLEEADALGEADVLEEADALGEADVLEEADALGEADVLEEADVLGEADVADSTCRAPAGGLAWIDDTSSFSVSVTTCWVPCSP
jgi:hypothetical protein